MSILRLSAATGTSGGGFGLAKEKAKVPRIRMDCVNVFSDV